MPQLSEQITTGDIKMKFLLTMGLLLSAPVFAADVTEIINTRAMVSVNSLRCEILPGSHVLPKQKTATVLGHGRHDPIIIINEKRGSIELRHKVALVPGCDLENLDRIADIAKDLYSFIYDANIEVTKTTSDPFKNHQGRCLQRYNEQLKIDLGFNVILNSSETKYSDSDKCE